MNSSPAKCYSYIRFSSKPQERGDSLRRQLELSKEWARKHGLVLDDKLQMKDLGKSAFHGDHTTTGALGAFLTAVSEKRIPTGSILLVESLDRLSREAMTEALQQFLNIIKAGIKIVTLADGMEYTRESINANIGSIMMSLVIMSRGHEESLMKSKRIQAVWQERRRKIKEEKISTKCPGWLSVSKDRKSFILNEKRAEIVKRMFQLAKDGHGQPGIERIFNEEAVESWGTSGVWNASQIREILNGRSVIGEYQQKKKVDGKWTAVGEAVADYYPRIITDEVFYSVLKARQDRRWKTGRLGNVNMLFAHVAKCGHCGAPFQYVTKGGKGFLVCDMARRGLGCEYRSLPYADLESVFLKYMRELDMSSLGKKSKRTEKAESLEALEAKMAHNAKTILRVNRMILEDEKAPRSLVESLKKLEDEQAELANQKKKASEDVALADVDEITEVKDVIAAMEKIEGEELANYRLKLRESIRKAVKTIRVFPNGVDPDLKVEDTKDNSHRLFVVELQNGHARAIWPNGAQQMWDPEPGDPPADNDAYSPAPE